MAFADDVAAVVTETGELRTALKALVTTLTTNADQVTLSAIGSRRLGTDDNTVEVKIVLEAGGVNDAILAQLQQVAKALRVGSAV